MPAPNMSASTVVLRPQALIAKALDAVERFSHIEAVSGIVLVLVLAAIVALLWVNSSAGLSYEAFWHTRIVLN